MTQISYDHGVSDKKLIGETIGSFFDRTVEIYRDREALVVRHQNVRWSWGELGRRVDDLAQAGGNAEKMKLADLGLKLQFDDAINVQFTSGTTGHPKGATLSHHNILNNGYFVAGGLRLTPDDRLCIPVPLYHCFGMVMGNLGCLTHGSTMVYPAESFDPLATLQAVAEERCTALYGVPTMFIAQLDHPRFARFDLRS